MTSAAVSFKAQGRRGFAREVFAAFLRLSLTSFGGPVAHLGYFRAELVERRRWLLVAKSELDPCSRSRQLGKFLLAGVFSLPDKL